MPETTIFEHSGQGSGSSGGSGVHVAGGGLELSGRDPGEPPATPIQADLRGLPPLLIQVGGGELLVDDVTAFVNKAKEADVKVVFEGWEDMFHCWQVFSALLPDGQEASDRSGEFVRAHIPPIEDKS